MYITSHSIRIVLLSRYVNIYNTMAPMSLGDWKTKPVHFELKSGATPYHSRAFPIPRVHKDKAIQKVKDKYDNKLVENIHVLCKEERLVIPKKLQFRAVAWYHHYLQHPGHTRLEETLKQAMYWILDRNANISPTICKTV